VTAPAVGCIAAPGTGRALALGALDVVSRPIDTDGVVAAVVRASSGPGRLVTASGDVEALLSVRQALTRKGTSVSMAWDAKQALDLLGMMRPDVVLVDLELGRQACSVVAALDGLDPVPFLLVVPADGDQAEGFGALTREAQRVARMVPLKTVVAGAVKYAEAARRAE
jgi:ActR/RegA family two-component response regulator